MKSFIKLSVIKVPLNTYAILMIWPGLLEALLRSGSALEYESRGRGFESYSGQFHSHKLSRLTYESIEKSKDPKPFCGPTYYKISGAPEPPSPLLGCFFPRTTPRSFASYLC